MLAIVGWRRRTRSLAIADNVRMRAEEPTHDALDPSLWLEASRIVRGPVRLALLAGTPHGSVTRVGDSWRSTYYY
ncbi:hypothetical protein GCM10009529_09850 [Micropruina glycogenica]